jgi:hypothetical protein
MEKSNDKDHAADDSKVEIIMGKAVKSAVVTGLRVTAASIKEDKDGGASAEITVTGIAHGMTRLVGERAEIETLDGARRLGGHVRAITLTEAKGGSGMRQVSLKVGGARQLADLVGRAVKLAKAQGELPLGVQDAVEAEEGAVPLGEVERPAVRARRKKGKGMFGRGAEARP